jgi:DNA gyrase subunit A
MAKKITADSNGTSNGVAQPALDIETNQFGRIRRVDIDTQMKDAYLSYSMSVIVSRALPDARDGLKPVQRRILYVMYDTGLTPTSPYRKSARIVGDVLGKYHPHGDASVYDAMARMAQNFSMRYMLVDGQGNFGSVDGDPPAAMRYTEARLSRPGMELLTDLDKETVNYQDNYDGSTQEPTVLPAALPNLIINGATGIAVGMATNIPPHNMGEIVDATTFLIDRITESKSFKSAAKSGTLIKDLPDVDVGVEDLMKFVKGPDFPTGGIIFRYNEKQKNEETGDDGDAIKSAYATGRGKIIMQAKAHIEDGTRGRTHIIVTELPYMVNKSALIERIADLARDEKITGITDIRDESDQRGGMRIVIDINKNDEPRKVLASLYKYTAMRQSFGVIMLALVDGEPRVLTLKKVLQVFIEHRQEIVRRRSEFDLRKAKARAHILEGLVKALDIIDKIIKLIRASRDTDTARKGLQTEFKFSEIQANAILEMPLRRLAQLERKKLEDELAELRKLIKFLEDLLASPGKILSVIKDELLALKEKYNDPRRTTIVGAGEKSEVRNKKSENGKNSPIANSQSDALTIHELMPTLTAYVVVGQNGKIARLPDAPRVTASTEVVPAAIVKTTTKELVYVVGSSGKAVALNVNTLTQEDVTTGSGQVLSGISGFSQGDDVVGAFALDKTTLPKEGGGFVVLATSNGMIKRSELTTLPTAPGLVFTIVGVNDGDSVISARMTTGVEDLMLFTQQGQAIRFKQEEVRHMGLPATGVVGIKLREGDIVMSMGIALETKDTDLDIVLATTDGKAKRVAFKEYPTQGRAGQGVITAKLVKEATVADAVLAEPENTIVYVTLKGNAKSLKAKNLTRRGRPAAGDDAIALSGSDLLAKLVVVE